jgi:hypothetical protein
MSTYVDRYLSYEQQKQACKISALIVCAAALLVGMRAFGKDLIHDFFGDKNVMPAPLSQSEKIAHIVLFASAVVCIYCQYYSRW